MSQSRNKIAEEFGISFPSDQLPQPPCQPPKGKAVLERFYKLLNNQKGNLKDANYAAYRTAVELEEVWKLGDARIPRLATSNIQKKVFEFYEELKYLKIKSKAKQAKYLLTSYSVGLKG